MQVSGSLSQLQYLNLALSSIYNCAWKPDFLKYGHILNLQTSQRMVYSISSVIINFFTFAYRFYKSLNNQMWPDLPKGVLYTHSFKTHFSSPSVSYINAPTGYVFTTAESWTVCFHSGLFLKPVWRPQVLR